MISFGVTRNASGIDITIGRCFLRFVDMAIIQKFETAVEIKAVYDHRF